MLRHSGKAVGEEQRSPELIGSGDGVEQLSEDLELRVLRCIDPLVMMAFSSYSRDKIVEQVLMLLNDSETTIVELCGKAGVGKSTLLKRIAHQAQLSGKFSHVFSIVLPDSGVLRAVRTYMGAELDCFNDKLDIFRKLRKGSFLMLFDNLVKPLQLEELGIPLPLEEYDGKIVFATRQKMGLGKLVQVSSLPPNEDLSYFYEKFEATHPVFTNAEFEKLASQIVSFCLGLPMALDALAGTLREKSSVEEWQEAYNKLNDAATKNEGSLDFLGDWPEWPSMADDHYSPQPFGIIKFSFDSLPSLVEKECLRYVALFPKDHVIRETDLIEYWIGQGFLLYNVREAVKKGENIIQLLIHRKFLEKASHPDRVKAVKMHHALRDMFLLGKFEDFDDILVMEGIESDIHPILEKTSHQNLKKTVTIYDRICYLFMGDKYKDFGEILFGEEIESNAGIFKKWRYHKMVVMKYKISDEEFKQIPFCPNLETLFLDSYKLTTLPTRFFHHLPFLKVLDLSFSRIQVLSQSIGDLKYLQYLNLSSTDITSLPSELGRLRRLKCLKLSECFRLFDIPQDCISRLVELQLFEMVNSSRKLWENFGKLIQEMECLEHLGIIKISVENFDWVKKLWENMRLASSITHLGIEWIQEVSLDFSQLLMKMSNLEDLQISSVYLRKICIGGQEKVVAGTLKRLSILVGQDLTSFIVEWNHLPVLQDLRKVEFLRCPKLKSMNWVKYLPNLIELIVRENERIEDLWGERLESNCDSFFPKLRYLTLDRLSVLKCIGDLSSFHSLEYLIVHKCPMLKTLSFSDVNLCNIKKIKGEIEWWNDIEMEKNAKSYLSLRFKEIV